MVFELCSCYTYCSCLCVRACVCICVSDDFLFKMNVCVCEYGVCTRSLRAQTITRRGCGIFIHTIRLKTSSRFNFIVFVVVAVRLPLRILAKWDGTFDWAHLFIFVLVPLCVRQANGALDSVYDSKWKNFFLRFILSWSNQSDDALSVFGQLFQQWRLSVMLLSTAGEWNELARLNPLLSGPVQSSRLKTISDDDAEQVSLNLHFNVCKRNEKIISEYLTAFQEKKNKKKKQKSWSTVHLTIFLYARTMHPLRIVTLFSNHFISSKYSTQRTKL